MSGFLAYIMPVESGGRPDQGLPQPPLGTWGGAGQPFPTPPIHLPPGGPPPIAGWTPPGFHPSHPIAPGGGGGTGIWGGAPLPWPGHPIAPGGPGQQPPGIWPSPGHPDQGLPGPQPTPTPPIYLPPGSIPGVEHPIYIPPSVNIPNFPNHPIVVPPAPEKPQVLENWDVKSAWSPQTGWVVAIVPSEEHPGVPTPSR
jgi:hypothetical protein